MYLNGLGACILIGIVKVVEEFRKHYVVGINDYDHVVDLEYRYVAYGILKCLCLGAVFEVWSE